MPFPLFMGKTKKRVRVAGERGSGVDLIDTWNNRKHLGKQRGLSSVYPQLSSPSPLLGLHDYAFTNYIPSELQCQIIDCI